MPNEQEYLAGTEVTSSISMVNEFLDSCSCPINFFLQLYGVHLITICFISISRVLINDNDRPLRTTNAIYLRRILNEFLELYAKEVQVILQFKMRKMRWRKGSFLSWQ